MHATRLNQARRTTRGDSSQRSIRTRNAVCHDLLRERHKCNGCRQMHFIDVSSIISTGKTLSTFPFLTLLCNCLRLWHGHKTPLQFPSTRRRELLEENISRDFLRPYHWHLSLSCFFLSISLSNRRGRSIYAAERDKRQWTSNVAILKCRYQSHVHLFQPSCEHCFLLFLLVRPVIFTSPWRNMELFSLIIIDICLSWVMLFWGQLDFFPDEKDKIHCILFNLI